MVNAGSWSACSGSVVDKKVAAPALVATRGCSTNQRSCYKLFNDPKYNIILSISNQRTECRCRAASRPEYNGACDSSGTPNKRNPSAETDTIWTEFVAETLLPTQQGKFRLRGYRHTVDGGITFTEPSAVISGEVERRKEVVVRVHDACFTSEVLGSLKCDCREQLQLALQYISEEPPGMVIYLQQEGRGIGLANKIAAYALQEKGLDTVDANRALGLPDDCREYSAVRHILEDLEIESIKLMTNNPRKIEQMESLGIKVTRRVPCIVRPTEYNEGYLSAKQKRMDHMFPGESGRTSTDESDLDGQFCYWNHEGEPSSSGVPLESEMGINLQISEVAEAVSSGAIEKSPKDRRKKN
eukprot:jgi/Picsp_1/6611/NSC_03954-R1_gtp cyclohydrolase ii